ncbi:hypothetical protein TURU_099850 [Turdus rufiventris]|nr:hypothetical protein TURU_099850 [Turdus rufiventris]
MVGEQQAHSSGTEGYGDIRLTSDTSGVLQGSILGPALFNTFINNLDTGLEEILIKFASNTKLGGAIKLLESREALQRDLEKSEKWTVVTAPSLTEFKKHLNNGLRNLV